ncbi:hypothetical protein IK110_00940 [Candidatus Saccharibacteria bacterium]|nr:hypothetical protein [Candidatus Saccharibacteria bacterium]
MAMFFLISALISLLFFGSKFEKMTDSYIGEVYTKHLIDDAFKTHFALYGMAYWTGLIAFLCLPALVETIHDSNSMYCFVMSAGLIAGFIVLAKICKIIYKISKAREAALVEYLAG